MSLLFYRHRVTKSSLREVFAAIVILLSIAAGVVLLPAPAAANHATHAEVVQTHRVHLSFECLTGGVEYTFSTSSSDDTSGEIDPVIRILDSADQQVAWNDNNGNWYFDGYDQWGQMPSTVIG